MLDRTCYGAADLEDEPPTRTQRSVSLRKKPCNDLDSGRSAKHGIARLKFPNLELYLIFFRFADVGRVGDDKVRARNIEALEQVGLMELDSFFQLMAGGVGARDFESCSRYIGRVDFSMRKFFDQS